MKLCVAALFLLVFVAACKKGWGSDFAEMRAENARITADGYRSMWGVPLPAAEATRTDAQFECLWDALTEAGKDPVPELQCFSRRRSAYVECFASASHDRSASACDSVAANVCSASADFQRATRACINRPPTP